MMSDILDIGDRRQVFIDGRFLQVCRGIELVVHPPRKTGEPTLEPEHPWEARMDGSCSILKVGDLYHLWYRASSKGGIAYASSKDGIRWEKPMLGLAEVFESKRNNIVLGHGAGGVEGGVQTAIVFLDPNGTEGQQFRMVAFVGELGRGLHVFSSGDGIQWKLMHQCVVSDRNKMHLDTLNVILWDDRINEYVSYVRRNLCRDGVRSRTVARGQSAKLSSFPDVEDSPVVLGFDHLDPRNHDPGTNASIPVIDFYTNATIKYPWAEDAYYMFPSAYYHYRSEFLAEFKGEVPPPHSTLPYSSFNAGTVDVRFAASRDGIHWKRYDRRALVPLGMKGSFDSKQNYMGHGLVPALNEREMYMYYGGNDRPHGWGATGRLERNNQLLTQGGLAPTEDISVLSRLVFRRDGFISARAAYTGGEFTTPVLRFNGNELMLNVDTSAVGELRVEILDELGAMTLSGSAGYRLEDCDRIHTTNEINRVVTWQGKSDISELARKPIRLRFVMRDVDLYAFQFS